MSVRPDVLPQAALDELAILQDAVKPFETSVAIDTIEREQVALGDFFDEISEQLAAAASLAQVYARAGGHGHVRRGEGAAPADPEHRVERPVRLAASRGGVPG